MNDDKCHGIFGRIFGHKFQPRFSETDTTPDIAFKEACEAIQMYIKETSYIDEDEISEIMNGFRVMNSMTTTYVHDVCIRCGRTIQKI
jgi:hypothetical protein